MTSDEDIAERKRLYTATRDDLLKRQLSNAENFDKAILSLATASLGFSLAFLKDIVHLGAAHAKWLVYASWICFAIAVVTTLVSYEVSQRAITTQLTYASQYYLENDEAVWKKPNRATRVTQWLNTSSGVAFVVGLVATIVFVSVNV